MLSHLNSFMVGLGNLERPLYGDDDHYTIFIIISSFLVIFFSFIMIIRSIFIIIQRYFKEAIKGSEYMLSHSFVIIQCSVIGIDKVTVDQYGINGHCNPNLEFIGADTK